MQTIWLPKNKFAQNTWFYVNRNQVKLFSYTRVYISSLDYFTLGSLSNIKIAPPSKNLALGIQSIFSENNKNDDSIPIEQP